MGARRSEVTVAVPYGHNDAANVLMTTDNTSSFDADPDRRRGMAIEARIRQLPAKPEPRRDDQDDQMPMQATPIRPSLGNDEEERIIIQAVLKGDLEEFQILVRRYHKPIYHLMFRALRDTMTAEDLTQETFARVYEKLHTFKAKKRFFPWLYTIAVNLCKDYLRRQGIRRGLFSDNADAGQWPDPDGDACAKKPDCILEVAQVAGAMDKLPILYSEPMLLFYREGFTVKEISNALGISSSAVKVRIHRGRKKLMHKLGVGYEEA